MSGIMMVLMAGVGSTYVSGAPSLTDIRTTGTASAGIVFNTDGSISYSGGGSGPAAWWFPSGFPPSTWISWTTTGGTGSAGNQAMTSLRSFSYSCPLNGTPVLGTITVNFYSDAGLTNLVGTFSIRVDVESSNR